MADRSSSSNIYTVLALVAFLALACAIGYVWYRSSELFGGGSPFSVAPSAQAATALVETA